MEIKVCMDRDGDPVSLPLPSRFVAAAPSDLRS